MIPTARSRVFAIIGDPVVHSVSPRMHNAAFTALGLDAVYVALRVTPDTVSAILRTLAQNGGGGNVTLPYKAAAAQAVTAMQGPLPDICNTFWAESGTIVGDNTDVVGVKCGLESVGALAGGAERWLVVGTGGSARAVAEVARELGVFLVVRSREPSRALEFLARTGVSGASDQEGSDCEVVINCTPFGLEPSDALPLDPAKVPHARWALDLVYAPGETAWVRAMRSAGCVAADGREVLVRQGAAALERWFPERQAPLEVMRAAVRAALA
jgi:shikimate dehydrogenase